MSDSKSPRWKAEVTRPESTLPEPLRIDAGKIDAVGGDTFGERAKVDTAGLDLPKVPVAKPDGPKPDSHSTHGATDPTHRPHVVRQQVPKQAIIIGIAGGAVLGALLAWGILSIVWWRRDVNQEAEFAAEVKAREAAEAQKKAAEAADPMRQFSTQRGQP